MKEHELRQKRGRTEERYWLIARSGNRLFTEWGTVSADSTKSLHGHTDDVIKAKGKPGTLAFVSAEDNALFNMERAIRKKLEEGYEGLGAANRPEAGVIDHGSELPKNLAFCKPSKKPPKKYMGRSDLICTTKYNGETVIAHKRADGLVKIYSRRLIDMTSHFPHLDRWLAVCREIPNKTVMLFEGFMGRGATRKDAIKAASIFRSKARLAVDKQTENGFMKFYLFRVPVWGGKEIERNTFHREQLDWIAEALTPILTDPKWRWPVEETKEHPAGHMQFLYPIETHKNMSVDAALAEARAAKLEGFVAYVPDQKMADMAWSFHGKPDRPTHFFKVKTDEEDDFIVRWAAEKGVGYGTYGSGKNKTRVGTLSMFQIGADGKSVYCGEVGTGLTDEDRETIATNVKKTGKTFVCVAEVHFETRFFKSEGDKTNAIQLPRFHRFRYDKEPAECVCEQLTE